jgi:GGDEF domain-containing protein
MNLAPGEYEFQVKAVNAAGKTSAVPASFKFEIGKHWWQTVYFQLVGLAGLTLLVYSGYRLRTRQMRKQEEELKQLVKERTEQLNQAYRDLQNANRVLEEMASSDGLTGLHNRRHFDQVFDTEWLRARREGRPIALIIADVDQFKSFNDHYGHLAGDDCLKAISGVIKSCAMRPGGIFRHATGEKNLSFCCRTLMRKVLQRLPKSCASAWNNSGYGTSIPVFPGSSPSARGCMHASR